MIDYKDAFNRFTELPPLDSTTSNPYLRPYLDAYTTRRLYIEEPDRYYLGAMDRICGKCGAVLFQGEMPEWCSTQGRTEVGTPETAMYEDDNDDFGDDEGAAARANQPVDPNE